MSVVYFAHTKDSRIKVGTTIQPRLRFENTGWKQIALIPGSFAREKFLLEALAPWRLNGEFFRPCVDVWRAIIEAKDYGDLPWVPPEPLRARYTDDEKKRYFAEHELNCTAAGIDPPATGWIGLGIFGKVAFAAALKQRKLPGWLLTAHVPQALEAAQ